MESLVALVQLLLGRQPQSAAFALSHALLPWLPNTKAEASRTHLARPLPFRMMVWHRCSTGHARLQIIANRAPSGNFIACFFSCGALPSTHRPTVCARPRFKLGLSLCLPQVSGKQTRLPLTGLPLTRHGVCVTPFALRWVSFGQRLLVREWTGAHQLARVGTLHLSLVFLFVGSHPQEAFHFLCSHWCSHSSWCVPCKHHEISTTWPAL